jgi:BASS family bile acid:Na+ symporter
MTNQLRFDYPTFEYFLAATQLVLATLGLGVTLRPRDFGRVLGSPRALVIIFAGQLLLTPLIAIAVNWLFDLPQGFVVGMVLMGAMPTGAMASIFVYLGRGHIALALATTGITTLASLVTTTAVLRVFAGSHFGESIELPVGRMLTELAVCLLLPLAVAMSFAHLAPVWSQVVGKWCVRGSLVTLSTLVIGSLTSGRLQIAAYGWRPPLALATAATVVLVACFVMSLLGRLPRADSFTAAIVSTIRNGNLALLLKARLFPATSADPVGDAVLYVVLFYSGAMLVVSICAVVVRRVTLNRRVAGRSATALPAPAAGDRS